MTKIKLNNIEYKMLHRLNGYEIWYYNNMYLVISKTPVRYGKFYDKYEEAYADYHTRSSIDE